MENAMPLKAADLRDGYKLLGEYGNVVLAGKDMGEYVAAHRYREFNTIYAASPDEFLHRTRAVYMYLKDHAVRGSDCWPAANTIAADLQLSRSTVKRALHDLVKAGLIEKESRYRENGSRTSNRLILKKQ